MTRPYVTLSVAQSIDGYIDDATDTRLLLSNDEDFDRVDQVRSENDAILVGSNTIRQDNPRLILRSEQRQAARVAKGLPANPVRVIIAGSRIVPADARVFSVPGDKIVYCPSSLRDAQAATLAHVNEAHVVAAGDADEVDFGRVLDDLGSRGFGRLMVEGGQSIHTQFLTADLANEIHLAVAPFFVGDPKAPKFVGPGLFAQDSAHRMHVAEVRQLGDVVLIRYLIER